MASAADIAKLETKAVAAEKLIELLRQQISQIKIAQAGGSPGQAGGFNQEVAKLKAENAQLKTEVDAWKSKLTAAEVANGKKVICSGPVKKSGVAEKAPEPVKEEATEKKEKKPAKGKGEKKEKPAKEKKEVKKEDEAPVDIGRLDLRVGHIRKATRHPDADSLYVEEIDCGDGEGRIRTVISGLVKFIPEAEMQDRMVVVLCNLKPSKMRGIVSEAMVMCASTPDKVEILTPPPGCVPGDRVLVEGVTSNPDPVLNPKKKVFETCAPDLQVNGSLQATYKGVIWTVSGKPVTAQSLAGVQIK